ncbi:POT family-domain-containing protein [Chytriomyces sp. MP71]|nr:POT family-domain-containing protein [Chytriomyces sp. MP71]
MNKERDAKILANPNRLPTAVYFIIPNELGERFCYYGITPILKNFLKYQLGYHIPADANALKDAFSGLCYFTPILGAIISDSFLDKFKTIVSLSSLYLLGLIILTITSWPTIMGVATTQLSRVGPMIGLLFIAFGTGGIKPCVSAHGGDQFILPAQKYGLQIFYNYFYMAINVGALVSSIVSPMIAQVQYFPWPDTGNKTLKQYFDGLKPDSGNGYPYSFLMLTCFFFAAMSIFILGFKTYRVVPPAGKFILFDHFKVGFAYLGNRYGKKMSKEDAYQATCDVHTEGLVVEMFDLVAVIGAVWPAPFFWMAFNQNSGVWQDMGDQMVVPVGGTGGFFGSEIVNNFWNPFYICLFAPLVANFLYPYIDRKFGEKAFGLQQRMVAGMLLASVAFIVSALMQRLINNSCVDGGEMDSCQSSVSIMLELILYAIMTLGEVLFSISGINFTYIEVGKRTKSSCAAIWLVLSGIGSFVSSALLKATMSVDQTRVANGETTYDKITWNRENFMWLLAGLCFGSCMIQYWISRNYIPKAMRSTAHI